MKKVFLTFALVFATETMMNASSSVEKNNLVVDATVVNCVGFAFAVEGIIGREMTYKEFSAVVDACEAL